MNSNTLLGTIVREISWFLDVGLLLCGIAFAFAIMVRKGILINEPSFLIGNLLFSDAIFVYGGLIAIVLGLIKWVP